MTDPRQPIADVMTQHPGLHRAPAALLAVLSEAPGRVLVYTEIAERLNDMLGGNLDGVDVQQGPLKHLRRYFRHRGGVEIVTHHGVGLRLVKAPQGQEGGGCRAQ